MKLPPLLMSVVLLASWWVNAQGAQTLYDVSFESPTHLPGKPPVTGGSDAPSAIYYSWAEPIVVNASGHFSSQYLRLESTDVWSGHQKGIRFDIANSSPRYEVEFDVQIDALPHSVFEAFSILFQMDDSETWFSFRGGGELGTFAQGPYSEGPAGGAYGSLTAKGDLWTAGQVVHVSTKFDLVDLQWGVLLNGEPIAEFSDSEPWPILSKPGANLRYVAFQFDDGPPYGDSIVGIDNIRISAVPEPLNSHLLASAILLASLRRLTSVLQRPRVD